MWSRLNRMVDGLVRWIETALALILIGSVFLNCANIAGRYFFHYSITGADEIQIFFMICLSFVGLMVVSWRHRHLRMDVLVRSAPPWVQNVLSIVERVLTLVLTLLLLDVSFEYVFRMYQLGITSENVRLPLWIPHASITVGFALTALVTVVQIVSRFEAVYGARKKSGDA